MKLIFKPFSQVHRGKTRQFGGTGLGLVISRHIIERLGGKIDVRSEEGHGTEFTISIPLPVRRVFHPTP